MKRKHQSQERPSTSKHQKTASSFPFMALAPDLRNNVYEKVLEDHAAHLSRNSGQKKLACSSALARVSKDVRREFGDMVETCAPLIKTTVRNFNFSHIVTFLNRLSDAELKRMEAVIGIDAEASPERVIQIELVFTKFQRVYDGMTRWLNRMDVPTKNGTRIKFQYIFGYKTDVGFLGPLPWQAPYSWLPVGPRYREEKDKIDRALQDGMTGGFVDLEDLDL